MYKSATQRTLNSELRAWPTLKQLNHQAITRRLKIIPLAAVIFLTVSGGPYGLEPLLSYAGKHGALILLLLTPLLWDVPTIFVVMELNSMMPVTGGYYQWVKRA